MRIRLVFAFIIIVSIIITILLYEKEKKIKQFLDEKTFKYIRAYNTVVSSQNILADFITMNIVNDGKVMKIYHDLQDSTKEEQTSLRKQLLKLIEHKFNAIKKHDISQLQFHLKNNISFLRLSNPDIFGDDLTLLRPTIAYTNKYQKPISGIEQGKLVNAYRYIFPINSNITNEHLGSIGVSFTIDSILIKIMKEYGGTSCFMINKDVVEQKVPNQNMHRYILSKYKNYYYDNEILSNLAQFNSSIIKNLTPPDKLVQQINKIVQDGKSKTIYNNIDKTTVTIIPIKNPVTLKQIAFIKIENKVDYIVNKTYDTYIMIILSILLVLIVLLFIYKQKLAQIIILKEKNLVQNILNSTPNITFVTDFRTVIYANTSFLTFFNTVSIKIFNDEHPNILDIFLPWDDYLHHQENQLVSEFIDLMINTDVLRRKVMMFDKSFNLAAFSVSISKVNYNQQKVYLLTLTNITEQEIQKKKMEHKAYYDGLTNVYNRNKFNELFEIELRKARRYNISFCIAIIDIDHFKVFNDTYGHLVGDEVLTSLAFEVNQHIRDTDTFARWGGEEFVILLSDTELDVGLQVCEKLRQRIENLKHRIAGSISASFGITQYKNDDTLEIMFKRCDDALYKAKKTGRNKVQSI